MSYIPSKAMHHAQAEPVAPSTGGGELGGVPDKAVRAKALGWLLGAAGAGLAVAAAAALLSLGGSSAKPTPKRRQAAPRRKATAGRKPRKAA